MVKILQAYNFAKQNTFSLSGEILAATLIDANRIAISSAEQFIEIYAIDGKQRQAAAVEEPPVQPLQPDNAAPVPAAAAAPSTESNATEPNGNGNGTGNGTGNGGDERSPCKYSLATVGEVVNLIYCEGGRYLVTLEKENVGSPVHSNSTSISCTSSSNSAVAYSEDDTKMFVRIYANFWKFADAKLVDMPITIRIASMTTPKAPLVESIDVIELPLRSPPDLIQCCQTSGNIIVGSKDRIYLYEYTQCMHETTQPRFSYIDFLPFKFFVNLNFVPLRLSLAENVIACMNNRYCVAFKVVDMVSGGGAVPPLDNNYEASDEVGDVDGEEVVSSAESSILSKASGAQSSRNSFETDSVETTTSGQRLAGLAGFPGRTPVDFNVARMVNSACGREFEVDLRSQWEQGDSLSNVSGGAGGCGGSGGAGYDSQEITITPTRATDVKIKLVNEAKAMNVQRISANGNIAYNEDISVHYDIRKLLAICMKTSEPNGRVVDILRCMDLKAIYQRNPNAPPDTDIAEEDNEYDMGNQQIPGAVTTSKHANRRTLKSAVHQSCIGYALMVASSVDGYLYQFCGQGKWYNENEKPIATYSFTAPVLRVHLNDYVIYAVTTESVETHTSRMGHKLFNNRFEYPSVGGLFPEESSPDVNAAIAVVGLCSFVHVQFVCVNRDNLVLISNSTLANQADAAAAAALKKKNSASSGNEAKRNIASRLLAEAKAKHSMLRGTSVAQSTAINEWTLYNLEIPQVEHVVDDLEGIAESYRSASSTNFYDLMEEAHVMLRLSLSLRYEKMSTEREQLMREKFTDNCRKLADFSIRSTKKEVYLQATGFYKMCNLQLPDIYADFIKNEIGLDRISKYQGLKKRFIPTTNALMAYDAEELVGLIYTVKAFLLGLGTERYRASFLNQLVRPFFTPNRVIGQGFPQVPLSLELLNMFIKYSAADIPQIMLNSPVVADAISGELINYLKYLDVLNPDENLLLAVTACRMSNYLLAQEAIANTSRHDLAVALIKYKNVLFDDGTVLYQKQRGDFRSASNGAARGQRTHVPTRRNQHKGKSAAGAGGTDNGGTAPQSSQAVVSFSDFTETILLATENADLIEAISDAFVHALCIEHSVTLDLVLQLFLNYIATHIGHKGYQTSQKVFVNILQVYYYDLFDVNPLSNPIPIDLRSHTPPNVEDDYDEHSSKAPSINSERDNESVANSIGESHSGGSSSLEERSASAHRHNRIVYDQLQEQQSPFKQNSSGSPSQHDEPYFTASESETNMKGLKILFRMYLGRLKALSDLITDLQSADVEQQATNEDFLTFRMECIKLMIRHLQELRMQQQQQQQQQQHSRLAGHIGSQYYYPRTNMTNAGDNAPAGEATSTDGEKLIFVPFIPDYKLQDEEYQRHISAYIRPIPCLLERPQYLNRLPPFKRSDFSVPNRDEGEFAVRFLGWNNELLTLTLKIQSLLASAKIDREIIEEFIAFIQKTPTLIGVDSFLVIVLPKHMAMNYMLSFCPEYMWHYGKSNGFTTKHWESILRKILSKQDMLPNWKSHITEILNNLVAELSFEELLQCFPSEVIQNRKTEMFLKEFTDNRITYEQEQLKFTEPKSKANGDLIKSIARDHLPMDNVDESNVFELTLRKAVSKQRSIALRSMIESTGTQLFEATSNPMYNL